MAKKLTKNKTDGSLPNESIEGDSKEPEPYEELFEKAIQETLNSPEWKKTAAEIRKDPFLSGSKKLTEEEQKEAWMEKFIDSNEDIIKKLYHEVMSKALL